MPLKWLRLYLAPILFSVLANVSLHAFGECKDSFDDSVQEISPLEKAKTSGYFVPATTKRLDHIMGSFLDWKRKKDQNPMGILASMFPQMKSIERVQFQDSISFEDIFPNGEHSSNREQVSEIALKLISENMRSNPNLNRYGYDGISSFAIIQGFAGLWSRGGGEVVKGLVPVNLAELIDEHQKHILIEHGQILADKKIADADPRKIEAKEVVHKIIYHASDNPSARSPALLKLLQAAYLSYRAKAYIPLDFWTSRHTHSQLRKYLRALKSHPEKFAFHTDKAQDSFLKKILVDYFAAGDYLGETNVIGVQNEVPLIKQMNFGDEVQFEYSYDFPLVGEGAGMHAPYYNDLGRRDELMQMGVQDVVFQNIEVFSPIEEEFAVHWQQGKPVSLTSVPIQQGYSGGAPYKIAMHDNTSRLVMLEDSNVPSDLKEGNLLFNANTIFLNIHKSWSPTYLAFEPSSGVGYRVKVNAGDVTIDLPTTLIRGEIPRHYVNLKKYEEYLLYGVPLIENYIFNRMQPVE